MHRGEHHRRKSWRYVQHCFQRDHCSRLFNSGQLRASFNRWIARNHTNSMFGHGCQRSFDAHPFCRQRPVLRDSSHDVGTRGGDNGCNYLVLCERAGNRGRQPDSECLPNIWKCEFQALQPNWTNTHSERSHRELESCAISAVDTETIGMINSFRGMLGRIAMLLAWAG
jgi:hypothetical protein